VYPWWIEPRSSLHDQTVGLIAGVVVLAVVSGVIALRLHRAGPPASAPEAVPEPSRVRRVTGAELAVWMSFAGCGSFLLSAVTSHVSQNVASVPLLWVLPLIAYLLSFVVAFGGERRRWRGVWIALALLGIAGAGYLVS